MESMMNKWAFQDVTNTSHPSLNKVLSPAEIYIAARRAGDAAVFGGGDGYPCGFAWINIKPATGPFIKYLKSINVGKRDEFEGGYRLSSYDCCAFSGQNVDVKAMGVEAFAAVLRANGIKANTYTRLD